MWQGIDGHDRVVARLRETVAADRLASTYLFVGPEGVGKRTLAVKLAAGLLCQANGYRGIDPCGQCASCKLVRAGTHPDLEEISRPVDKNALPLETFIGDKEHRHQEGLCHRLALKPQLGDRKVAVIDDADDLTQEAANSLLKTLEEPPPRALLILIATSGSRLLPTIRSRCQVVRFAPLRDNQVAHILLTQQLVSDPGQAQRLATAGDGSVSRAVTLADEQVWQFRQEFLERLANPDQDRVELVRMVSGFVDRAGREAAARRRRARAVIRLAGMFYREVMRAAAGARPRDTDIRAAATSAGLHGPDTAARALVQVERCLLAQKQVDRNLNQTTLLECWLDDLYRMGTGQFVPQAGSDPA